MNELYLAKGVIEEKRVINPLYEGDSEDEENSQTEEKYGKYTRVNYIKNYE